MSGHSKWNNIKHKKEKNDAAKAGIFTKIGKEIAVAVRAGGGDPNSNSKLRDLIAKAKANNIPNDNIERAIKKSLDKDGATYEEMTYEGYGPGGVAVIVEATTDNRNRTAGNIRSYFNKYHGNMGTSGCVSFMFDKKGQIIVELEDGMDEEELMMTALDAGAEDFEAEDGTCEILTDPDNFSEVYAALEVAGITIASGEVTMIPQTWAESDDPAIATSMEKMIDMLEDDDDVQNVYHNWDN